MPEDKEQNLQERLTLANGLELAFYDTSRPLAGDRWLVELQCEVIYPLEEEMLARFSEPDPELRAAVLARLDSTLNFTVTRTRHFVDEQLKEELLAELLAGVKEHMLAYFAKPGFPARLFADTCGKLRDECRCEISRLRADAATPPEDEGPSDFSALFRSDRA